MTRQASKVSTKLLTSPEILSLARCVCWFTMSGRFIMQPSLHLHCVLLYDWNTSFWDWRTAQGLRSHTALAEDMCSVPKDMRSVPKDRRSVPKDMRFVPKDRRSVSSTHVMCPTTFVTSAPRDLMPSAGLCGHLHVFTYMGTHAQMCLCTQRELKHFKIKF